MSETKHTPAPWIPDLSIDKRSKGYVRAANRIAVARVTLTGHTYSETFANAHLIAAAPELLAACKRLLAQMNGIPDYSRVFSVEDYTIVQDAIAKAEGRNG